MVFKISSVNLSAIFIFIADIIFCLIYYPVLSVIVLPLYLYRKLIYFLASIIRPDLKPLDNFDLLMAWDAIAVNQHKQHSERRMAYNVGCSVRINGKVSLNELQRKFEAKVLSDKVAYYKMFEYLVPFGGFAFRKEVKKFNINVHIKEVPTGIMCVSQNLEQYQADWIGKPYALNTPPWEIVLIYDAEGNETILLLKVHHCYGDAYSLLHLFNLLMDNDVPIPSKIPEIGFWERALEVIECPRVSVKFSWNVICSRNSVPYYPDNRGKKWFVSSTLLYFSDLKKIQRKLGVPYTAVTLTLFGGVFSRILEEQGKFQGPEDKDKCTYVQLSLPWPNHPVKTLCNHWTTAAIKVPLAPAASISPIQRIKLIEKDYNELYKSKFDKMMKRILLPATANIPTQIVPVILESLRRKVGLSAVFTSVSGYNDSFYEFNGNPVISFSPLFAFYGKSPVITGLGLSFHDSYECSLIATEQIASNQETMDRIVKKYFPEELDKLLKEVEELNIKTRKDSEQLLLSRDIV